MTENKNSFWTLAPLVVLVAIFCCVLWGSASPAIKIAYELFKIDASDTPSRLVLAGARFMLAGVMTIFLGSILAKKPLIPQKDSWKYIVVLSLFQTIGQYYFFFMSLANTSGVRGSIINASGNFLAPLFAIFLFKLEKVSAKKLIGCATGFLGIIMFFGGAGALVSGAPMTLNGEGAMLAAAFFYAISGCSIKIFSKHENPVILSGYQFFLGGAVLLIIGLALGGSLNFYSTGCYLNLIYMGFISAGAYTLWGVLLKYNPVSKVSVLGFVNPIMGVLLSALFLGEGQEALSMASIVALLLVSAGIIIVNYERSKKWQEEKA
ncbi:Permease of the drug/metabolite transporter (DMT) superfamily [Butyrivibrio sp. Su6]|uniref:DMT family transporter n=1 Tax=Butyrivibrio sp. Su6 TaxID=1520810 RepID=UPI00089E77DE|nr:DMT family transporter [Butyrivibrio sp. Su6]SEF75009.1 Permease of the drug/metabolite transporter (DMT) superfamily [Butyrivibrio sp. Su6]